MATYRIQRLFSKKNNKVAGHAVGAAVQGAVSGALLRDALKTKSNLAGAGAVLAGTAAALHTAEAIKAARKKGKEFSESQKEFTSVRDAKKLVKLKGGLLKKVKRKGIDPAELTSSFEGKSLVEGALVKAGSRKPYSEKTWNSMVKGIESGKINPRVVLKESEKIKKLTGGHMQQIHGSL
jgi:hypothetical protein